MKIPLPWTEIWKETRERENAYKFLSLGKCSLEATVTMAWKRGGLRHPGEKRSDREVEEVCHPSYVETVKCP